MRDPTQRSLKYFRNRSEQFAWPNGIDLIAQSPEMKTTKSAQPRSHGKRANTKTKFPRHSRDVFARFSANQRHLGLKTTPLVKTKDS